MFFFIRSLLSSQNNANEPTEDMIFLETIELFGLKFDFVVKLLISLSKFLSNAFAKWKANYALQNSTIGALVHLSFSIPKDLKGTKTIICRNENSSKQKID